MYRHGLARPLSALTVVAVLVLIPLALWHRVLADVLVSFNWSPAYVGAELGPFLLLLGGVAFLIPVAISAGLDPESRLYPRSRRSYFIWGVVLYLLGSMLAVELFDVWAYSTS
jgi:hypothetical protein